MEGDQSQLLHHHKDCSIINIAVPWFFPPSSDLNETQCACSGDGVECPPMSLIRFAQRHLELWVNMWYWYVMKLFPPATCGAPNRWGSKCISTLIPNHGLKKFTQISITGQIINELWPFSCEAAPLAKFFGCWWAFSLVHLKWKCVSPAMYYSYYYILKKKRKFRFYDLRSFFGRAHWAGLECVQFQAGVAFPKWLVLGFNYSATIWLSGLISWEEHHFQLWGKLLFLAHSSSQQVQ